MSSAEVTPGTIVWIDPNGASIAPIPPALDRSIRADARSVSLTPAAIARVSRWTSRLAIRLAEPAHEDLRAWNSTDVTRRVRCSAADAMRRIGGTDPIEWSHLRGDRRLTVDRFRRQDRAIGAPNTAEATLTARRGDAMTFTITIFGVGRAGCMVHLRCSGRRPWGRRGRRRSLAATHDAADRIVEVLLAVDFRHPDDQPVTPPSDVGRAG